MDCVQVDRFTLVALQSENWLLNRSILTELLITVGHRSISAQNSNYTISHAFCRKFCPVKGCTPNLMFKNRKENEVVGSFK